LEDRRLPSAAHALLQSPAANRVPSIVVSPPPAAALPAQPVNDPINIHDLPTDEQDPELAFPPKGTAQPSAGQPQPEPAASNGIDWSTLMLVGPSNPWGNNGPKGQTYSVKTTAGNTVFVWKANAGEMVTYFCHGLTFGGTAIQGGPYSPYSGPSVATILKDAWQGIDAKDAVAGNIIVWYGEGGPIHSAILTNVALLQNGQLDPDNTKLDTKNGQNGQNNLTLAQIQAIYGTDIKIYKLKAGQNMADLVGIALALHKKGSIHDDGSPG
jgi:hypothetical protein